VWDWTQAVLGSEGRALRFVTVVRDMTLQGNGIEGYNTRSSIPRAFQSVTVFRVFVGI
jgi:hypothetical protein